MKRSLAAMQGTGVGIRFNLSAADIIQSTESIIVSHGKAVDSIVESKTFDFKSTFEALALADGKAATASTECVLPALVSPDKESRDAASQSKKQLYEMWQTVYARKDVYDVLRQCSMNSSTPKLHAQQQRFVEKTLQAFERNGMALPEDKRAELTELRKEISNLASTFEQNINEDVTVVSCTREELEGLPDDFLESLTAGAGEHEGKLLVGMKAPQLVPVLQRAKRSDTRKRMNAAASSRCADSNGPVLTALVEKRQQAAALMGWKSHADFMLAPKMAGTPEAVVSFLTDISDRLEGRWKTDMEAMVQLKREEEGGGDGVLHPWDVSYYERLLKERDYALDENELKKYFPMQLVREQTLAIYSEILGVTFAHVNASSDEHRQAQSAKAQTATSSDKDGVVWHPDVELYCVSDTSTGALLGYIFLDLFSRDGKFGHQMVVPLRPAFTDPDHSDGKVVPVCTVIGNMSKPSQGKPSLLRFAEVKTCESLHHTLPGTRDLLQ
jgi:Zn-dependent oligopeptidase